MSKLVLNVCEDYEAPDFCCCYEGCLACFGREK